MTIVESCGGHSGAGRERLDPLFAPRSVAIVGASERVPYTRSLIARLSTRIDSDHLHLVNPRREFVDGLPTAPSLDAIRDDVDFAFIALPADSVCGAVREAIAAGVQAGVVLSDGFSGFDDRGRARALELKSILADSEFALCGPGSLGVMNIGRGIEAFAGRPLFEVPHGDISLVAQSGGLIQACIGEAISRNLGFSLVAASGSESGLTTADYLEYFARDPDTQIICVIMEELRHETQFATVTRDLAKRGKHMCVLKLGRSDGAERMARTHTGSVSGRHDYYQALFSRLGVLSVTTIDEMMDCAAALTAGVPRARASHRAVVVATSGGAGAMTCDVAVAHGISVPALGAATSDAIRRATRLDVAENPLELSYQIRLRTPSAWRDVISLLGVADEFNLVIVNEMIRLSPDDLAAVVYARVDSGKTVALCATGRGLDILPPGTPVARVGGTSIPMFPSVAGLVRAVELITDDATARPGADGPFDWESPPVVAVDPGDGDGDGMSLCSDYEARQILGRIGVPSPREVVLLPGEKPLAESLGLRFPVCVKVNARGLAHRSEHGLVLTGVDTWSELDRGISRLDERARAVGLTGYSILVQEQVASVAEIFLGVDTAAGARGLITIGSGGALVELLKDTVHLVGPATPADVLAALARLRCFPLLNGFRGRQPADTEALARTISDVIDFAMSQSPQVRLIEMNPLLVREVGEGVCVVDALVGRSHGDDCTALPGWE
jgi:acetate---CoA ligase (ADP-forming)